jgi:hypothetical protein
MAYGFKYAKNTGRNPGYHPYTDEDMKHIGFCIKKGIKIAVIPYWEGSSDEWKVELNINKKIHLDPNVYKANKAHEKMYEYAKYYYEKYNKSFK